MSENTTNTSVSPEKIDQVSTWTESAWDAVSDQLIDALQEEKKWSKKEKESMDKDKRDKKWWSVSSKWEKAPSEWEGIPQSASKNEEWVASSVPEKSRSFDDLSSKEQRTIIKERMKQAGLPKKLIQPRAIQQMTSFYGLSALAITDMIIWWFTKKRETLEKQVKVAQAKIDNVWKASEESTQKTIAKLREIQEMSLTKKKESIAMAKKLKAQQKIAEKELKDLMTWKALVEWKSLRNSMKELFLWPPKISTIKRKESVWETKVASSSH